MDSTGVSLSTAHELYTRADSATPDRPPVFKAVGISLAVSSGLFIGTSFVLKKTGLLRANAKYNEEAGEGYGYLKNAFWWTGMTLMIIGEICNFVAYAFVDAILVTPLGALSVVVTTILSAIFLKERLSFVGKVGCFLCIVGSVIILLSAPAQSSAGTIQQMQHFVIAPGFLSYAGVVILGCAFIAFWAGPRYGKKSMLVYLSICSLIGGLSVVATQGLGAAIVAQAGGTKQYNQPFLYILFVFVVATLLTEIVFLNKALNIFNAALVTPTYYVYFTSATIVTSAILFQGFKGSVVSIINVVLGFLVICCGVILLQLSKSAKDVPDTAVFKGDLDQVREVAEQQEPETEPKADAIRGTAAIIRRMSQSRQKLEAEEARRIHEEKQRDLMEPIGENEQIHWDGLRRRKTTVSLPVQASQRRRTLHPPLGMSSFPEEEPIPRPESGDDERGGAIDAGFASNPRAHIAQSTVFPPRPRNLGHESPSEPQTSIHHPVALTEIPIAPTSRSTETPTTTHFTQPSPSLFGLPTGHSRRPEPYNGSSDDPQHPRPITWTPSLRSSTTTTTTRNPPSSSSGPTPPPHAPHTTRRQFSFQNVFHRHASNARDSEDSGGTAATTINRRSSSRARDHHPAPPPLVRRALKTATEEERMGLVQGDSASRDRLRDEDEEEDGEWDAGSEDGEKQMQMEEYERQRREWAEKKEAGGGDRKEWEGHGPPGGGGAAGAFL